MTPPIFSARVGAPVTVVASLMLTVTLTTSPAFNVLFYKPLAPLIATALTVGANKSTACSDYVAAVLLLPTKSIATADAKSTVTLPGKVKSHAPALHSA